MSKNIIFGNIDIYICMFVGCVVCMYVYMYILHKIS